MNTTKTEKESREPTQAEVNPDEKQQSWCFLLFLHPGREDRLGWLMWKAVGVRGSERRAACPSGGVSAAQQKEAGTDSQALIQ